MSQTSGAERISNTSLIALVDLYEQASAATSNLHLALSRAARHIEERKEEERTRRRVITEPNPDLYDVLQDALNILDAAIHHEDHWKSAGVVPMLRILHGRIKETLNKSQTGGTIH